MNKDEQEWVKTARDRGYSLLQMQNHLRTSSYPEEKIKEFSDYYTQLSLPKKRFNFGKSLNIFKKRAVKIILFITIGIPIWLYLLTLSPRITGAVLGITIIFLLIGIIYLGVKRKMNKEMEIVHNVRYPTREPAEDSSGIGRGIEIPTEGKRIGRSDREPKRRKKLQVESPSKVGRGEISDRKPDRSSDREHEEVRETIEPDVPTIPDVEPID